MTPTWATILVALGSSAVGGLLVALVQTRHERRERVRDRMLSAAEDFVAAAGAAEAALHHVLELRAAADELAEEGGTPLLGPVDAAAAKAFSEADRCIDAVREKLARVVLLYGVNSGATIMAHALSLALRAARTNVAEGEAEEAGRSYEYAVDVSGYFADAARVAIVRGWAGRALWRVGGRLRLRQLPPTLYAHDWPKAGDAEADTERPHPPPRG